MKKIIIIAVVLVGILAYLNNYSLSKTNRDYNQPIIEDDVEPAQTTDETKENDKDEVIQENINDKKSYTNGETNVNDKIDKQNDENSSSITNSNQPSTSLPNKVLEETNPIPPQQVEQPKEEVAKKYEVGNCGELFDTEQEATNEAERKMDDFSDESRYVSSYLCYSTYDKWSINYYYTYW